MSAAHDEREPALSPDELAQLRALLRLIRTGANLDAARPELVRQRPEATAADFEAVDRLRRRKGIR